MKYLSLCLVVLSYATLADDLDRCDFMFSDVERIGNNNWLDKSFISNKGYNCQTGIKLSRDAHWADTAYYKKPQESSNNIVFRFKIDTAELLKSYEEGDYMAFYKFSALYNEETNDTRIVKVFIKKILKSEATEEWQIIIRWFNNDLIGSAIDQFINFSTEDNLIQFQFFWTRVESQNHNTQTISTSLPAGMVITVGEEKKPNIFISPFKYEEKYSDLKGNSYLGYINSNQNFGHVGDEIRLIPFHKYLSE